MSQIWSQKWTTFLGKKCIPTQVQLSTLQDVNSSPTSAQLQVNSVQLQLIIMAPSAQLRSAQLQTSKGRTWHHKESQAWPRPHRRAEKAMRLYATNTQHSYVVESTTMRVIQHKNYKARRKTKLQVDMAPSETETLRYKASRAHCPSYDWCLCV